MPHSRIAPETGMPSPWISRLLKFRRLSISSVSCRRWGAEVVTWHEARDPNAIQNSVTKLVTGDSCVDR